MGSGLQLSDRLLHTYPGSITQSCSWAPVSSWVKSPEEEQPPRSWPCRLARCTQMVAVPACWFLSPPSAASLWRKASTSVASGPGVFRWKVALASFEQVMGSRGGSCDDACRHPHSHPSRSQQRGSQELQRVKLGPVTQAVLSTRATEFDSPRGLLFTPHVWSSAPELLFSWVKDDTGATAVSSVSFFKFWLQISF